MKILYLYSKLVPDIDRHNILFAGGAQKRVYQMAVHFASLGYNIFMGSDDKSDSIIINELKNKKVRHIPFLFRGNIIQKSIAFYKLYESVKKEKIDIIHCNDRKTTLFGYAISLLTKSEMVYTARNTFYDKLYTKFFFGKNIIAVSNGVKNNLFHNFKIKKDRISVIYNGTDIKQSSSEEINYVRAKYQLSKNNRIIVSVGRLSKQKGLFYLLDAITKVKLVFPEVVLLLVGDGELQESLVEKTKELSLDDNIIFCGNQKHVQSYYEVSEFTVMSSLWEGLPGSGIESIMLGKPLIGTTVGGIPEIIKNGKNGFLVPPRDSNQLAEKIIYLLSNPKLVKLMSQACVKIASEKFTLSQMMKNYHAYYKKFV